MREPTHVGYQQFLNRLLGIYRRACGVQRDGRFSDAVRAGKVAELDDEVLQLCGDDWFSELPKTDGAAEEYRLLINEIMRLHLARELFPFVTMRAINPRTKEPIPISGTNNAAERGLRPSTQARKTGRTNKTIAGARRRTIICSVLDSLSCVVSKYTMQSVIEEIQKWQADGQSCFSALIRKQGLMPKDSILDNVLPQPSG